MRASLMPLLALAASVVLAANAGAATTQVCPARSIGPGAIFRGSTAGAECMLRAYRHGCATATYELSSFGVDTIATLRFQLVRRGGSCTIGVTRSFHVVPQKPRVTGVGRCKTLRRTATDIVATGCSGSGLASTASLTRM